MVSGSTKLPLVAWTVGPHIPSEPLNAAKISWLIEQQERTGMDRRSIHGMYMHIYNHIPIRSMYGIYANIWGILMVNVTIYGIHGSYGY